ncbi:MAG: hypothetical protein E2591_27460 [Achromobacter sp.]|uniref:hypothetical protein n=1 Tax=Achromobacter sp. TaxID=134375 RepID=UPI0012BE5C22|nr:hypothetical protein [Achromobacter sp.]MPS81810.1 hypothetical protein [Achromobacter sp.]
MNISQIPFEIATNESSGEKCLLIPDRAGRGTPARARVIAGSLVWTAQDGLVEQVGDALSLPTTLLDQLWVDQQLLVIPINDRGIPCRDFLVTPV